MHRLKALLIKEFIQMARDRTTFAMMIGIPIIQLIIFGFAVNTDVKHLPTAVFDQSLSSESRDFLNALTSCEYFDIAYIENGYQAVDNRILAGKARVGIIIPPTYADDIKHHRTAQVQVLVDASDSTSSNSAIAAATMVGQLKSQEILTKSLPAGSNQRAPAIDVRIRPWFNPDGISAYYMVPGIVAVVLTMTMVMVTSMAVVREKENGTLEQLLVTPLRPYELMLGKIIPYIFVGYIQAAIAISVGILLFDVPFHGSLLVLFVLTTLFIVASLALGILISTVASTQNQAMQMSMFVFLPSMMLSGYLFPRESMPKIFYWLGNLLPMTYYLQMIRGVVLKGVGIEFMYTISFALLAYAIALFVLSVMKFKTKLG